MLCSVKVTSFTWGLLMLQAGVSFFGYLFELEPEYGVSFCNFEQKVHQD